MTITRQQQQEWDREVMAHLRSVLDDVRIQQFLIHHDVSDPRSLVLLTETEMRQPFKYMTRQPSTPGAPPPIAEEKEMTLSTNQCNTLLATIRWFYKNSPEDASASDQKDLWMTFSYELLQDAKLKMGRSRVQIVSSDRTTQTDKGTSSETNLFKRNLKMSVDDYPIFEHAPKFIRWEKQFMLVAKIHGIEKVFDDKYAPTTDEEIALHDAHKAFAFQALMKCVRLSPAKRIIEEHADKIDARTAFKALVTHFASGQARLIRRQQLSEELDKHVLTEEKANGKGVDAYFAKLQELFDLMDDLAINKFSTGERISKMISLMSGYSPIADAIQTFVSVNSAVGKNVITDIESIPESELQETYKKFWDFLKNEAQRIDKKNSDARRGQRNEQQNQRRNNQAEQSPGDDSAGRGGRGQGRGRGGRGRGRGGRGNNNGNSGRQVNAAQGNQGRGNQEQGRANQGNDQDNRSNFPGDALTWEQLLTQPHARLSPTRYGELTFEQRRELYNAREGSRSNRPNRQANAATQQQHQAIQPQPGTMMWMPQGHYVIDAASIAPPSIAPGQQQQGHPPGSMIRQMLSNNAQQQQQQPPSQIYYPGSTISGPPQGYYRANAALTYRFYNAHRRHPNGSLIDGGANGGLCGEDMTVLTTYDECVDVIGVDDQPIKDLPLVECAGKVTAVDGTKLLLIFYYYAHVGRGRSIHAPGQVRDMGHKVDDVALSQQGSQCLTTALDGYIIPFSIRNGLPHMDIAKPTSDDLANLRRVHMTNGGVPWDPTKLDNEFNPDNHQYPNRDTTFGLNDPRINDDGDILHDRQARVHRIVPVNPDYKQIALLLGFTNELRARKTLENTTQYYRVAEQEHPLHAHKSRWPAANVPRLNDAATTDTYISEVPSVDVGQSIVPSGTTLVQIYSGIKSKFVKGYPMYHFSDFPKTLERFIRDVGAPNYGIISDNALYETSKAVQQILNFYNIRDFQNEPHYPNQNPVERRMGDISRTLDSCMSRTQTPKGLWLVCLILYVIPLLNVLSHEALNWKTPFEAAFNQQPDSSAFLRFMWYQPVDYEIPLHLRQDPNQRWGRGRFCGVAETKGGPMTLWVLSDTTHRLLPRSVVRNHVEMIPQAMPAAADEPAPSAGGVDAEDVSLAPLPLPNQPMTRARARAAGIVVNHLGFIDPGNDDASAHISGELERFNIAPDSGELDEQVHDITDESHCHFAFDGTDDKYDEPVPIVDLTKIHGYDKPEIVEFPLPPLFQPSELVGQSVLLDQDTGEVLRAKVVKQLETVDEDNKQRICYILQDEHGKIDELIEYNELSDLVERQMLAEMNDPSTWQPDFEKIVGHQGPLATTSRDYQGSLYNLLVQWRDGEITYEPLAIMIKMNPVKVAEYGQGSNLLNQDGWKKLQGLVRRKKRFERMLKQAKRQSLHKTKDKRFKFGVQVPRTHAEAVRIDIANGNTMWQDAIQTELDQLKEYNTFEDRGIGAVMDSSWKRINAHFVFDVKHDLRRKARLVAGGHMTAPPKDSVYSGVVSLRGIRTVSLLAEMNGLDFWAADIGNAYLEAKTKEKVYIVAGAEFGPLKGHTLVIFKALYGLRTSGARWHDHFADTLRDMGFQPSFADPDIWMKDCLTHYEYVCVYVDDLAIAMKDPKAFLDALIDKYGYKIKGIGPIKYHLGADFFRDKDGTLCMSAETYIKRLLTNYKVMFGEAPKKVTSPLEKGDHPELDTSEFLNDSGVWQYQSIIGQLQWAVSLCRFDIHCAVMTMGRFRAEPRVGHRDRLKRIVGYLSRYPDAAIRFRGGLPNSSWHVEPLEVDWSYQVYGDVHEELPYNMPTPRGKPMMTTTFIDANLLHDFTNGRSAMGALHFFNQTPIDWFSKRQNTVETATYGSEFVVARAGTEQIMDHRYTLRMLGVPLTGPAWMFGDNMSVITSSTVPQSSLSKRHNALSYHRVREAIAAKVLYLIHIESQQNIADVLTKFLPHAQFHPLIDPVLFWKGETIVDSPAVHV